MRRENTWEVPGPTTGIAEHLNRQPRLFPDLHIRGCTRVPANMNATHSFRFLRDIKLEKWTGHGIRESGKPPFLEKVRAWVPRSKEKTGERGRANWVPPKPFLL